MKLTRRLLAQLINEEMWLFEAAITTSDAETKGLALFTGKANMCKVYMLYDMNTFIKIVDKDYGSFHDSVNSIVNNSIYAVMATKPNRVGRAWNAAEVVWSAAKKGYGPLLYDIVMADTGGIMSDRETVSPDAKRVWSYYKNKRKDVEARQLDDEDNPQTPTKEDDGQYNGDDPNDPLNYAYFAKSKPNIAKLLQNHEDTITKLHNSNNSVSSNMFDSKAFKEYAEIFFHREYGSDL